MENAKTLRESAEAEARDIVAKARLEAEETRSHGEALAKREAGEIVASAKAEAAEIKKNAVQDLERERTAMHEALREKVLAVAIRLNEKLFAKSDANVTFLKEEAKHSHF